MRPRELRQRSPHCIDEHEKLLTIVQNKRGDDSDLKKSWFDFFINNFGLITQKKTKVRRVRQIGRKNGKMKSLKRTLSRELCGNVFPGICVFLVIPPPMINEVLVQQ